jgi:hypothetical protein
MHALPSRGAEPFPPRSLWQGEERSLLERAIRRHGGWAAWTSAGTIAFRFARLDGLLPTVKGVGRTLPLPTRIEVVPRNATAVFEDFPARGSRGMFTAGEVRLLGAHGEVLIQLANGRDAFQRASTFARWSPLQALYFFGYAITHYHSLPFTLVDGRPLALTGARVAGYRLRGVRVELPDGLHTHSRIQTFFFDDDGLIRRHDYVAEVVGPWAHGAHFWEDFTLAGELAVARRRHVVARLGARPLPVTVLHAELTDVSASPGPIPS